MSDKKFIGWIEGKIEGAEKQVEDCKKLLPEDSDDKSGVLAGVMAGASSGQLSTLKECLEMYNLLKENK